MIEFPGMGPEQLQETPTDSSGIAREEHTVYELFKWSVLLKGAISVAEVVVGIALLVFPVDRLIALVQRASMLVSAHAGSAVAEHLAAELAQFGEDAAVFVALYLLSRGLIKCGLIWALLRNVLWAYPASLAVLGLFLAYQLYQIATTHSLIVVGITVFDLVVMYFIWREWRIVERHRGVRP